MSLGAIVRKELKELLTIQALLPVIVMSLLFGAMGTVVGDIEEEAEATPVIGVIDQDASQLSAVAVAVLGSRAEVVYNGTSVDEGMEALEEEGDALLIIREGFQERILSNTSGVIEVRWIVRGSGLLDIISTGMVEGLLAQVDEGITYALVEGSVPLNATVVLHPTELNQTTVLKEREMEDVSPHTIESIIGAQAFVMPLVIIIIIMASGGTVISSMGLEKENKTLETLLTLPVKRTHLVAGKIMAAAIAGLVMALIYMVGFAFYMNALTASDLDPADYGLSLGPLDYLLVAASLFTALLAGLAIAMVLGTFAKDYKSAQTLTFILVPFVLIPMFLTMFKDFDTMPFALKVMIFAIPFSHPIMSMKALMFDDYLLVGGGIAYSLVFAIAIIMLVVRIFNTDKLLTGRISKGGASGRGLGLRLLR